MKEIYPQLRAFGWRGYWIDAASVLRMESDAVIIFDPVNRPVSIAPYRRVAIAGLAVIAP